MRGGRAPYSSPGVVFCLGVSDVGGLSEAAVLPDLGLQCGDGEGVVEAMVRPGGRDRRPRGAALQIHDPTGETRTPASGSVGVRAFRKDLRGGSVDGCCGGNGGRRSKVPRLSAACLLCFDDSLFALNETLSGMCVI